MVPRADSACARETANVLPHGFWAACLVARYFVMGMGGGERAMVEVGKERSQKFVENQNFGGEAAHRLCRPIGKDTICCASFGASARFSINF